MNFFLDENFPRTAEGWLTERGHRVYDIRGTKHEGADDPDIFQMAQDHQAVFLSTDKDFFHTLSHLCPVHHGIVVIALRRPNRRAILAKLSWFLEHFGTQPLAGRAFLLRDRSFAVYSADE
jgi:predicted nuclease of predicted toxin-antitoxin system